MTADTRPPGSSDGISLIFRRGDYGALREATMWLHTRCAELGASTDARDRLDFCMNELLANVIDHGLSDTNDHVVSLALGNDAGAYTLTVRDDGRPFDVAHSDTYTAPASLQDAGSRGYGLHLVHAMADRITYGRDAAWNTVTIAVAE